MVGRRNFLRPLLATAMLLVLAFGGLLPPPASAQSPALSPPPPLASEVIAPGWQRSWAAGTIDEAGRRMGGTEVMHLVVHGGKLYAGVGYWLDPRNVIYGGKDPKDFWAQILRLDGPDTHWRVDLDMPMHLRPEILKSVIFTTDGRGKALNAPVELLLAATYEIPRRGISLFTRDDDTSRWEKSKIIAGDNGLTGEDNSVRAMLVHRDAVTGIDRLFVSVGVAGIYSGVYDPRAPGKIRWDRESETGRLERRILAVVEMNGALYFSANSNIYKRTDGPKPTYAAVYDAAGGSGEKIVSTIGGIRGLTAIPTPSGTGQSLIFNWAPDERHSNGCIFRLDPEPGGGMRSVRETCLGALASRYLNGALVPFMFGPYNFFMPVTNPATRAQEYILGLDVVVIGPSIPKAQPTKGIGGFYAGALYAVRDPHASYTIHEVNGQHAPGKPNLVSVRSYALSPFPSDNGQVIYFGGYDGNWVTSQDTAWIFRTTLSNSLAGGPSQSKR
jgi:hypothetical protein